MKSIYIYIYIKKADNLLCLFPISIHHYFW